MRQKTLIATLLAFALALPTLARTPPEGVTPVENFQLERYLGLWYEIARTDNRFERNLQNVTAEYSMIDDEAVRVRNRGYHTRKEKWSEVTGKAYQIGEPGTGQLKVTFFWPFYGGYNVFELDHDDYQYALVAGDSHDYLWILARTPSLPQTTIDALLEKAEQAGFDTGELIWVDHQNKRPAPAKKR